MIKRLKKMEPKRQYFGLKRKRKMKMEQLKVRNGKHPNNT
jgi:hypothetical protein